MPSLRIHLHEETDAAELAQALTLGGYAAELSRERFAGDDDDEDVQHVVTTDAPAPEVDDLLGDTDAYVEATDPMSGTVTEVQTPPDLPDGPRHLKRDQSDG